MKKGLLTKTDVISILLCLVAIVPGLIVYSHLPAKIPTHFGVDGQPNGYSSRAFAVFGIPFICAGLQTLLSILTNRFWNEKRDSKGEIVIRMILPVVVMAVEGAMILYALGKLKSISSVIGLIMTVLYFVVGNYLPKVRRNVIYGIRTPHTLADPVVWDKTHRFAGTLMVINSILMLIIMVMDLPLFLYVFVALIPIIIIFIYSEIIYRKRSSV